MTIINNIQQVQKIMQELKPQLNHCLNEKFKDDPAL
jgi:hypothetical protein